MSVIYIAKTNWVRYKLVKGGKVVYSFKFCMN